nr:unnamed protein product [Digitaria exilis]
MPRLAAETPVAQQSPAPTKRALSSPCSPRPRSTAAPHDTVRLRHSPAAAAAAPRRWSSSPTGRTCGCGAACTLRTSTPRRTARASPRARSARRRRRRGLARGDGGGAAAYGRYLGLWAQPAPPLGVVHRPVLRVYDSPEQDDVLWVAVGAADESGDVLLRHGRHATSFIGVNADSHNSRRAHWVVQVIAARQKPLILPAPVRVSSPFPFSLEYSSSHSFEFIQLPIYKWLSGVCLFRFTLQQLSRPMVLWRPITYVRADDEGNFDPHPLARRRFIFYGRSVFQLTGVLSILLREWYFGIRLCVRAGSQGRLTPLVIDLPANEQPMDIVVLTAGSPGGYIAVSFSNLHCTSLVICSSSVV